MTTLEQSLSQIPAFSIIHEHLFSSAQPSIEQLKLIKEYGCSTVINLALTNAPNHIENEDRICLDLGLNYIHIPIDWEMPSAEQCLLVLDLVNHLVQNEIVWVHCAKNKCVSCLMYVYRQFYMNMDMPTSQDLLHEIWEPNETWTGLIHNITLQLQGRKATLELQQSLQQADHLV
ncbi:protein tyrosine phosphatase family protein [Acinetobacter pittii]|uniref:protein tyrosine phosphatase family protein n=1 Tax=Acinetobacter pittii TaxID=48296 RepID=UPI001EFE5749|nr:protein tyrosine phosphatase family protein [Acinetobacter pittii]MCG9514409.1 protein tyrosine phosphatase family protein [Acinetobacter pittii]WPP71365.1 protein tyrosine phosphatase family protein [Acinetobacter pittii]